MSKDLEILSGEVNSNFNETQKAKRVINQLIERMNNLTKIVELLLDRVKTLEDKVKYFSSEE